MRYGLLVLLAAFIVVAGMVYVFAQDRGMTGDEHRRGMMGRGGMMGGGMRGRMNRGGMMNEDMMGDNAGDSPMRMDPMGMHRCSIVAMKRVGDSLFVVGGATVYKINAVDMKVKAKRDLTKPDKKNKAEAEEIIKKCDKNGDGKINKDECGALGIFFKRMDTNEDGFITREEIIEESLHHRGMMGTGMMGMMKMMSGMSCMCARPELEVDEKFAYVHIGGTIYKLKASDLSIEASIEIGNVRIGMMHDVPSMPLPEGK